MAFSQDGLDLLQSAVLGRTTRAIGDTEKIRLQCVQIMSNMLEFVSAFGGLGWEKFKADGVLFACAHTEFLR